MLEEFIRSRRESIIEISRTRVALRAFPKASDDEIVHGIPRFLDQICDALHRAESTTDIDHDAIRASSALHGRELLAMGLTIAQVVHDYGDVCQAVMGLVDDEHAELPPADFKTFNLCLDDAIAEAVTEFSRVRDQSLASGSTERLGVLALEVRNLLNTATLAFDCVRSGRVASGGSTGVLLGRCIGGLRGLLDQSLAEVRLDAGFEHVFPIPVSELLEEVEIAALLLAQERAVQLSVAPVAVGVSIAGDRQALASALANLVHGALEVTPRLGHVSVVVRVTESRVAFDVSDACGGLPASQDHGLPEPADELGAAPGGVARGLDLCRKTALAHHGTVTVRDAPGKGCVFTLELPRATAVPPS